MQLTVLDYDPIREVVLAPHRALVTLLVLDDLHLNTFSLPLEVELITVDIDETSFVLFEFEVELAEVVRWDCLRFIHACLHLRVVVIACDVAEAARVLGTFQHIIIPNPVIRKWSTPRR